VCLRWDAMAIADEKYLRFTTYRRDGTPVSTATWVVPVDDHRVGFWTSSASGKAKRLRNNPAVELQPSDGRGRAKAGTEPVSASAVLVSEGPDFDAVHRRVKAKYGLMTGIARRLAKIIGFVKRKPFPYADRVVIVTLE
jgi:PPOX class probable F420-dependent enzyme